MAFWCDLARFGKFTTFDKTRYPDLTAPDIVTGTAASVVYGVVLWVMEKFFKKTGGLLHIKWQQTACFLLYIGTFFVHYVIMGENIYEKQDINYTRGFRGTDRILFSSDGLLFVTYDHYLTFVEII